MGGGIGGWRGIGGKEAGMFAATADEEDVVDAEAADNNPPLPPRPCFAGLPFGRWPRPRPGLPTIAAGGEGCEESVSAALLLEAPVAPAGLAAVAALLLVLVLRVLPVGAIATAAAAAAIFQGIEPLAMCLLVRKLAILYRRDGTFRPQRHEKRKAVDTTSTLAVSGSCRGRRESG